MKRLIILLLSLNVQAQECIFIFPEPVIDTHYSIWIHSDDTRLANGGHLFWIYRLNSTVSEVNCQDIGLYSHGSLIFDVRQVTDVDALSENPEHNRIWGTLETINIILGPRPNSPENLN